MLRARESAKRGPFRLAGGVQVHLWGEWLAVVSRAHEFAHAENPNVEFKTYSRSEFESHLAAALARPGSLRHAPFWAAFSLDENARNVLVQTRQDPAWPALSEREFPVISAFKLLSRWRDADQRIRMALLW